jgi:hypothetical protein
LLLLLATHSHPGKAFRHSLGPYSSLSVRTFLRLVVIVVVLFEFLAGMSVTCQETGRTSQGDWEQLLQNKTQQNNSTKYSVTES